MLNRRHIRIKVMQELYAYSTYDRGLRSHLKSLRKSFDDLYDMYIVLLNFIMVLKSRAQIQERVERKKTFVNQGIVDGLEVFGKNRFFSRLEWALSQMDRSQKQRVDWQNHDEFVRVVWKQIQASGIYEDYVSAVNHTLQDDVHFVDRLFVRYVATNDKLHDFLEDENKNWASDIAPVNTMVLQTIQNIDAKPMLHSIFKSKLDEEFPYKLYEKVILNYDENARYINDNLKNWDKDRVSKLDFVLMLMAVAEFLHFPLIPSVSTINEYIEISKEYSSPKSGSFINGILEETRKQFTNKKKIIS